jgi:hypothetical protein
MTVAWLKNHPGSNCGCATRELFVNATRGCDTVL